MATRVALGRKAEKICATGNAVMPNLDERSEAGEAGEQRPPPMRYGSTSEDGGSFVCTKRETLRRV